MAETTQRLKPQLKALQSVHAALSPLDPEGRRKVIEAIHALLEISAGVRRQEHPGLPQAKKSPKRR